MTVNYAWMIKGWLLGAPNVPDEITEAIATVIQSFAANEQPQEKIAFKSETAIVSGDVVRFKGQISAGQDEETTESMKRRQWSPEARAAQAERMRARQAARKELAAGNSFAPPMGGA